jgi:hypothetical protein
MDLQVGLSKGYCHFLFYSPPSLGMIWSAFILKVNKWHSDS